MPYTLFYGRFPEIAEKETRSIIAINDPDLPNDQYGLIEAYCDEPDCDCRRVFFNITSWRTNRTHAVIAYGWESAKYYAKWYGENNPEIIKELQGPILNLASPQSNLAPALLDKVTYVLKDTNYLQRIKRHYKMFRDSVDNKESGKSNIIKFEPKKKIQRNSPCPCGSGKKYKKCCGR